MHIFSIRLTGTSTLGLVIKTCGAGLGIFAGASGCVCALTNMSVSFLNLSKRPC